MITQDAVERRREYMRKYMRERMRHPELYEQQLRRMREYRRRPDVRARNREYTRRYLADPKLREQQLKRMREYRCRPDVRNHVRSHLREHRSRPEIRERLNAYHREYSLLQKARSRKSDTVLEYLFGGRLIHAILWEHHRYHSGIRPLSGRHTSWYAICVFTYGTDD